MKRTILALTLIVGFFLPVHLAAQNWSQANLGTNPPATNFRAVAFGSQVFVAVGESGRVFNSLSVNSPFDWQQQQTNNAFGNSHIYGIAYGNNTFVAVGADGKIGYSANGRTAWFPATSPFGTTAIATVVFTNGRFYAAANDGKLSSSANGHQWDAITNLGNINGRAIAGDGGNRLVLFGQTGDGRLSTNNGTSWQDITTATRAALGNGWVNSATFGNGRFVAVAHNGRIAHSQNGTAWTAAASHPFGNSHIWGVIFANGRFVATAEGGIVAESTDGAAWTRINISPATTNNFRAAITVGGDHIVAAGQNIIAYGPARPAQGPVPTQPAQPPQPDGPGTGTRWGSAGATNISSLELRGIAYGNGRYVLVGGPFLNQSNGQVYHSTDGINWPRVESHPFTRQVNGIAFGNGTFVAGGLGGIIARSTDGITWTAIANPFGTENIQDVFFGNNMFVAVGQSGRIAYASANNLASWTAVPNSSFGTSTIRSIANNGQTWIAVGDGGRMAISTNNLSTWTTVNNPFGNYIIRAITFGSGRWVAVGDNGIMTSTNGTTWTLVADMDTFDEGFNSVSFGNGRFIAGGGSFGRIVYSTNGTTWAESRDVDRYLDADRPAAGAGWRGTDTRYNRIIWVNNRFRL